MFVFTILNKNIIYHLFKTIHLQNIYFAVRFEYIWAQI